MTALTLPEAARHVGLPEAQLLIWASLGIGPQCRGNPYRPVSMEYERGELDRWLEEATRG